MNSTETIVRIRLDELVKDVMIRPSGLANKKLKEFVERYEVTQSDIRQSLSRQRLT